MSNKKITSSPEKNLYLLSFLDVVDRIDILLLEIRHLQQNIIYTLRTPSLYLPLRYEENLIFGSDTKGWDKWINKLSSEGRAYQGATLARDWIIRYPSPKQAMKIFQTNDIKSKAKDSAKSDTKSDSKKIITYIGNRIGKIWLGDDWEHDLRLQYHSLRALQILKQQTFQVKLSLIRGAIAADLLGVNDDKNNEHDNYALADLPPAAFSILRRGVLFKLRRFIDVLGNHRQQVSQIMSFGENQDPTPNIERRREMGIYMNYMTSRGRETQRDMRDLLRSFGLKNPGKKVPRPLLFHSWSHHYRVNNIQLDDTVISNLDQYGQSNDETIQHVAYTSTSFWSPDRPDLQPILAREVAVSLVRNQLNNLDDSMLSASSDEFTALMIDFKSIILEWADKYPEMKFLRPKVNEYLRIIAGDLLAATLKGVAYLYSLFLLRFANDLESQLDIGKGREIDLDMVYSLNRGTSPYEKDLLWHLELILVAEWVEKSSHIPPLSDLDMIVIDGVKKVTKDVFDFLVINTPDGRCTEFPQYWKGMSYELQHCMIDSKVVNQAKKWREKRSKDYYDEEKGKRGPCEYARTTRRLDLGLQNFLFKILMAQKEDKVKKAVSIDEETRNVKKSIEEEYGIQLSEKNTNDLKAHIENTSSSSAKPENKEIDFEGRYGFNLDSETIVKQQLVTYIKRGKDKKESNFIVHPRQLFRHLYDIPFQCATMRSIDLLKDIKKWPKLLKATHEDLGLGRDLFALALEFYIKSVESPRSRLLLCINLLSYQFRCLDDGDIKDKLERWLNTPPEESKKAFCYTELKGEDNPYDKVKSKYQEWDNKIKRHYIDIGASQVAAELSRVPPYETDLIRKLERLAGLKLKDLHHYLKRNLELNNKTPNENLKEDQLNAIKPLRHLMHWLAIRNDSEAGEKSCSMYDFHQSIFKAFSPSIGGTSKQAEDGEKEDILKIRLMSRIAMSNTIPIPNPLNPEDDPYTSNNSLALKELLNEETWKKWNKKNEEKASSHVILGNYDLIAVRPITIPCRCILHVFDEKYEKGKNISEEKFIPYFSRREIAFQFDIDKKFKDENVFYISAITLQRRSMRLSFLYSLINIRDLLKGDKEKKVDKNIANMELATLLNERENIKIKVFLSDGWNDLQLFFSTDTAITEGDLDWAFRLQKTLFQDFMVDRSSMLLTPRCLDVAYSSDKYNININTSIHMDGWLEKTAESYTERLEKNEASSGIDVNSIMQTPGHSDFKISLECKTRPIKKEKKGENSQMPLYPQILNWMSKESKKPEKPSALQLTDHINTVIEKVRWSKPKT